MMKNYTFECLVPGPKLFQAEVFPGRSRHRAKVSVGPKLSLGQTGCEPTGSMFVTKVFVVDYSGPAILCLVLCTAF